jgi:hypothetical protein
MVGTVPDTARSDMVGTVPDTARSHMVGTVPDMSCRPLADGDACAKESAQMLEQQLKEIC